jgi:NADPH2:quinone reductase
MIMSEERMTAAPAIGAGLEVRIARFGDPSVFDIGPATVAAPGPGEILLRQDAIGVNFIDVYHRTGLYALPMPAVIGVEGAGVVEAVGADVTTVAIGDRVVYGGAVGGYATRRLLPAWRAVRLPDAVSAEAAAALWLKGLTAHMLLTRTCSVGPGTVLLVHAAAGGLGAVLVRWAKRLGATVIGTVGSEAKAEIARGLGADQIVVGRDADFATAVRAATNGLGADYAIDGIGGATLLRTFDAVRKFGTVASVGQAAGPIPPIRVEEIGPMRSLSLARPSVMAYAADEATYRRASADLLAAMAEGIMAEIGARYPLAEAARAHADLEAGRTVGSVILLP